mgnify:CR=1 FL=1
MWRSIFLFLLISGTLYGPTIKAQNLAVTQAFAEKAFLNGRFATALPALQRVAFFGSPSQKAINYFKIAQCYQATQNYALAQRHYRLCYALAGDSLAREALLGQVQLWLWQGQYTAALKEITAVEAAFSGTERQRLFFYKALAYFGKQDFSACEEAFSQTFLADDSVSFAQVQDLLRNDRRLHYPNSRLAQGLSYLVPGLGQFYAGDFESGLNSLLLNGSLLGLTLNVAYTYTVLDALISVLPWLQRYYLGGVQNAKDTAHKELQNNQAEVYLEIITVFKVAQSKGQINIGLDPD